MGIIEDSTHLRAIRIRKELDMSKIKISKNAFGVKKFSVLFNDKSFILINFFGVGIWVIK